MKFKTTVIAASLALLLTSCVATADYNSEESEYFPYWEKGYVWGLSLVESWTDKAEEAGSDSPRYDGVLALSDELDKLYGGIEPSCVAVQRSSFSEFEGQAKDAWIMGCVEVLEYFEAEILE